MKQLLMVAGVGQMALAIGSLWIPHLLGWRAEVRRLEPLTREVFWTYAGYIWGAHVAFALVSILLPDALLADSELAHAVAGFISVWWAVRLFLQLRFRKHSPEGLVYVVGEIGLTLVFVSCAVFYGLIAFGVQL